MKSPATRPIRLHLHAIRIYAYPTNLLLDKSRSSQMVMPRDESFLTFLWLLVLKKIGHKSCRPLITNKTGRATIHINFAGLIS